MSELLPCPFCGGEAHTYKNNLWHVACERAHNGCVTMSAFVTEAEAIAAWNSRADYHGYEQAAIEAWESIKAWNSRAERTCHIEERYGNQYCTCCGEMVGTWDSTSELYIDGNMVELWNYCPNCGARRVGE